MTSVGTCKCGVVNDDSVVADLYIATISYG